MPRTTGAVLCAALLMSVFLGGCASAGTGRPAADPIIAAASKVTTSTPTAIVGYVLDFTKKRADAAYYIELVATKDGRLLYERTTFFTNAGMREALGASVPRATPEPPAEAAARKQVLARAARVVAVKDKTLAGVTPKIRAYLVRDSAGNEFCVTPDATIVSAAPRLYLWNGQRTPAVSTVYARDFDGLNVTIDTSYSPRAGGGRKTTLTVHGTAINSTDKPLNVYFEHNVPSLKDAAGRFVEGGGQLSAKGGWAPAHGASADNSFLSAGGSFEATATYVVTSGVGGWVVVWAPSRSAVASVTLPAAP